MYRVAIVRGRRIPPLSSSLCSPIHDLTFCNEFWQFPFCFEPMTLWWWVNKWWVFIPSTASPFPCPLIRGLRKENGISCEKKKFIRKNPPKNEEDKFLLIFFVLLSSHGWFRMFLFRRRFFFCIAWPLIGSSWGVKKFVKSKGRISGAISTNTECPSVMVKLKIQCISFRDPETPCIGQRSLLITDNA